MLTRPAPPSAADRCSTSWIAAASSGSRRATSIDRLVRRSRAVSRSHRVAPASCAIASSSVAASSSSESSAFFRLASDVAAQLDTCVRRRLAVIGVGDAGVVDPVTIDLRRLRTLCSSPERTSAGLPCGVCDCGSSTAGSRRGRLTYSVDDVLDLAPPDADRSRTRSAPTDLPALSRRCRRGYRPSRSRRAPARRRRRSRRSRRRCRASLLRRHRELVNDCDEQRPEALHGRNTYALVGGVRELDLRPDREHVERTVDLAADDGCLEPRMDCRDDGRRTEAAPQTRGAQPRAQPNPGPGASRCSCA